MPISNPEVWKRREELNDDPYGKACVDVAREVMRLLDTPEYKEFNPHQIICDADHNVKAGGITGFMAGCVAQMVWQCHSRGEEFREAWNKQHGITGEKAKGGIINPALMTIKKGGD